MKHLASSGVAADINASSEPRQRETVVSGRLLRLACNVHGLPAPHIVWSRDGVDLPTTDSLRSVSKFFLMSEICTCFLVSK